MRYFCIMLMLFTGLLSTGLSIFDSYGVKINNKEYAVLDYLYDKNNIINDALPDSYFDGAYYPEYKGISYSGRDIVINYEYRLDYDKLKNWLYDYSLTAVPAHDAKLDHGDMIPEQCGTEIDVLKMRKCIADNDFNISHWYKTPKVTSDDLLDLKQEYNKYKSWEAVYDSGVKISIPDENIIIDNNKIIIDYDFLENYRSRLFDTYNTESSNFIFNTHYDKKISVPAGTFCFGLDWDSEREMLVNAIDKHESLYDLTPALDSVPDAIKDFHPEDKFLDGTYIEVSLSDQHVWYYEDNVLISDSDCVTGNTKLKHNTPIGVYYVSEKVPGKYLIGADYKTWVNRWMRLTNSGIGLHDANWRYKFGGNIYTYDGSHGCINLPSKYAYDLYDKIILGTPVVIY